MRPDIRNRRFVSLSIIAIVLIIVAVIVVIHYRDAGVEKVGVHVDPPHYGPVSFGVFGDPRIGRDSTMAKFFYPQKLTEVIEEVNKFQLPLVVITGDLYWGDDDDEEDAAERSEEFLSMMAGLNTEWYPVMGNHEAEGVGWTVTRDIVFGDQSTYYSFDRGDCHFIILDTYMPGYMSAVSEAQMSWLEHDIRTTEKPHIFVFLHPPLYPTGPHYEDDALSLEVRDKLFKLFVEYEVDVVFCGHEHYYACLVYQGLTQVTTGGAGAQPLHDYEELDDLVGDFGYDREQIARYQAVKAFHYVVVDVAGVEVKVDVYDLDGMLIDTFSVISTRAVAAGGGP